MTAMDDEARLIAILVHLREPFERKLISKLPATAKRPSLDYVGHAAVTDRLNRYAPGWSYDVEPVIVHGNIVIEDREAHFVLDPEGLPHVVAVFGTMTIGGVSRQEVGDVDNFTTYGDELKKAISDFVRRGAMRFGVAIDLWSKEDLQPAASAAPVLATESGVQAGDGATHPSVPGAADSGWVEPEPVQPSPAVVGNTGEGEREPAGDAAPAVAPPPAPDRNHDHVWIPSPTLAKSEVCSVDGCYKVRRKSAVA